MACLYINKLEDGGRNEPERLKQDKENVKDDAAYSSAWQYVDQQEYRQIIEELKTLYAQQ